MKIKPTVNEILDKYFYKKNKFRFILSDEKLRNQNKLYIYNILKKNVSENIYYLQYSILNTDDIYENIFYVVKNLEDSRNENNVIFNIISENTYEIIKEELYNILINEHLKHYLLVLIDNKKPLDKSVIYNMYKIEDYPTKVSDKLLKN